MQCSNWDSDDSDDDDIDEEQCFHCSKRAWSLFACSTIGGCQRRYHVCEACSSKPCFFCDSIPVARAVKVAPLTSKTDLESKFRLLDGIAPRGNDSWMMDAAENLDRGMKYHDISHDQDSLSHGTDTVIEQSFCSSVKDGIEACGTSDDLDIGFLDPCKTHDIKGQERPTRSVLLCSVTRRNRFVKEALEAHPIAQDLQCQGKSIHPEYANDATVLVSDATIDLSTISAEERSSWRQCNLILLPEDEASVRDAFLSIPFRSRPKLTVIKEIPI